jgi:hypothetical protein
LFKKNDENLASKQEFRIFIADNQIYQTISLLANDKVTEIFLYRRRIFQEIP